MSTRLDYSIESLRQQIDAKFKARVEAAHDSYALTQDLGRRRDEWRRDAETRVRELSIELTEVADNELESFRLPKCPRVERFDRPEKDREQELERAEAARDKALTRLEAVHAPNGMLSLTANMLHEWFSL
jgi:hypothetical protein